MKKTLKNIKTEPAEATAIEEPGSLRVLTFTNRRAKTAEQKAHVLNRLLDIWLKAPRLRLGQLITMNSDSIELVHKEDLDLIDMLERMIK